MAGQNTPSDSVVVTTNPPAQGDQLKATETKVAIKSDEQPKVLKIELPGDDNRGGDKSKGRRAAAPDTDDVRRTFSGGFLKSILPSKAGDSGDKPASGSSDGTGEPTEAPTPEERRAERVLGTKPKRAKAKAAAGAEGESHESPAPAPAPAPAAPSVSLDQVARVAAEAATHAVKSSAKPQEKPAWPASYSGVATVLDRMATAQPEVYGDGKLARILNDFDKAERTYIADWRAKNPGEEFDSESPDHAEFYNSAAPDLPSTFDKDMEAAEKLLEEDRIQNVVNEAIKKHDREVVAPLVAEQQMAKVQPLIQRDQVEVITDIAAAIAGELAPKDLSETTIAKFVEEHPLEAEVINAAAVPAIAMSAAYRMISSGAQPYNQDDPAHRGLADSISRLQSFILSRPPAERLKGGKDFLPFERFEALPAAQRSRYWTVEAKQITDWIKEEARDEAEKMWQNRVQMIEKYGGKIGQSRVPVSRPSQHQPDTSVPQSIRSQVVTPSGVRSEMGGVGRGGAPEGSGDRKGFKSFMSGLLGRSVG